MWRGQKLGLNRGRGGRTLGWARSSTWRNRDPPSLRSGRGSLDRNLREIRGAILVDRRMSHPWEPDSPIELEDGTLRCKEHNLEVCEKCCVDYTFMREILGHNSEEEEEKQEEAEDKTNRCTVCGKRADKPCSKCKGVYCKSLRYIRSCLNCIQTAQ
jgi:hypothetical protein